MLVDILDQTAISPKIREEVAKCYPDAKIAHIKTGGNFAFLSRDQELNVYIKVHLRTFAGTRFSAGEDFDFGANVSANSAGADSE
jgi:maspardin